jgi:imidazole glycerol-phosphate synthase subunit HisH
MITIVDYGLGNIRAFQNVYKRLNIPSRAARTPADLDGVEKLILPGVGAFDHAMALLDATGMRPALDELVLGKKVPVLGVCLGMQILTSRSDEGRSGGLAWIPGAVHRFGTGRDGAAMTLPHMGWNDVQPKPGRQLFAHLESDARFYFLHSYYVECARPADSAALADYGMPFTCAVSAGNIHGVQFHPEKSHRWGTRMLQNFAEL